MGLIIDEDTQVYAMAKAFGVDDLKGITAYYEIIESRGVSLMESDKLNRTMSTGSQQQTIKMRVKEAAFMNNTDKLLRLLKDPDNLL